MFGYVRIRKGDLRVKEYEFYKAVYCGLCHHQKKLSRRLRYTLSYDLVLLALIRMGVANETCCFLKKRCPIHPLKGCLTVNASESLAYTAAASAILLYEKLCDDRRDERGIRRLLSKLLLRSAKKAMARAPSPELHVTVKRCLDELYQLEADGCPDVYRVADCFGKLLGEVFTFDLDLPDEQTAALYEIGYRTGRFIYVLDAYEDKDSDEKAKKYNPFALSHTEFDSAAKENLVTALDMEMVAATAALARLHIADGGIRAILENLIALGLTDVSRRIILKDESLTDIQSESEIIR